MSNGRNWSSQKGPANTWNPTKNADGSPKDKATDKDVLDGYYIDIKEVPGQYEKPGVLITIEDEEGVKHGVWCGTVLQDLIKNVRLGSFVRLQWLGLELKKAAQSKKPAALKDTDYFQNWDIFVDKDVPPVEIHQSAPVAKPNTTTPAASNKVVETKSPSKVDDSDLPF